MAAAGTALGRGDQRNIYRIGHEIRRQQKALLLAFGGEIIRLAGEAVLEVVFGVEDEIEVFVEIDDRRRVGDGDITRRLLAGAVEMLVVAIERNGEQRAFLPLEGDAGAGIVPHRGRAAAGQHHDHLFIELSVRGQALARRDFHHIAVVRGARGVVIEEYRIAAAPRPRLQLDVLEVLHVERRDDVEAFRLHPAGIGSFLLGLEFAGKVVGNLGVFFGRIGHFLFPCNSRRLSMIPKSGSRFSDKIMLRRKSCRS